MQDHVCFPSLDDEDLLFYDIEVFEYDSLIVFKDIHDKEVAHFWNNPDAIYECDKPWDKENGFEPVAELIRDKTLIGYNNYFYDDVILSAMLEGYTQAGIKHKNDNIIEGKAERLSRDDKKALGCYTLDCFQQIDVCRPSLKQIEGNMGRSILESAIPFDIKRRLTEEEKREVLEYCRYDVTSTIRVFKERKHSYFEPKAELCRLLKSPKEFTYCYNTTTLSAMVLTDKPVTPHTNLELIRPFFRKVEGIPEEVWRMWDRCKNEDFDEVSEKDKKFKMSAFGCDFIFGFGGLHGAPSKGGIYYDVKLLDVGSMYPSIIILFSLLREQTETYDKIRKRRLSIKHKDKVLSNALKLILNSVYGQFLADHSNLNDPLASRMVCIYGQMALFDLCRELDENGYQIVNANTDGVAFYNRTPDRTSELMNFNEIWDSWQKKWKLNLELDCFDKWVQKDVNNYLATFTDKDGLHIKTKGGDANKAFNNKYFSNNSARIIQIALAEGILNNKNPTQTICEHMKEPELFQYILKAGGTYLGVVDTEGKYQQKVNRVFAAREDVPYTKLYKKRVDGGLVNFPDSPERMLLWNGEVSDMKNPEKLIDFNHYIEIARKKLASWGCAF